MSKSFFEVFPTLKTDEDMKMLFSGVEVLKVATNSDREFIRVHILSRHLLQKRRIYEMEKMLKDQLFGRSRIRTELVERYELSGQYTPENLMNDYVDSMILELNERSVVERSMLQSARYSFEDGSILCLELTDTIVAKGKKESLTSYLEHVFRERFGLKVEVRVAYQEAKDSKLKYNEAKIRQEVEAILEHSAAVHQEKAEQKKEAEEKKEAPSKSGRHSPSQHLCPPPASSPDHSCCLRKLSCPAVLHRSTGIQVPCPCLCRFLSE